jgi:twitching motility two-component system response regulator PilH
MGRRIMIVDDDGDLLEELAEVLSCVGYEPIVVESSGDASRVARERMPDLVLLDLQMPAKDGFSVALELTRAPETAHIPIIGMTGLYNGRLWANLMMLCGFEACLVKPIEPDRLFAQIEASLKERDDRTAPTEPPREPRSYETPGPDLRE